MLETWEMTELFNKWSGQEKLRHVYFSLDDAARAWFENRITTLTTWDPFRSGFLQTFTSVVRKARPQALLETRAQLSSETIAVFTEEMNRVFRHADPEMSDEKKVCFLMHGVKQELFDELIRNPPKTVAEFLAEARTIDKTLEMGTRQCNRDVLAPQHEIYAMGPDDLRETIRTVVRE